MTLDPKVMDSILVQPIRYAALHSSDVTGRCWPDWVQVSFAVMEDAATHSTASGLRRQVGITPPYEGLVRSGQGLGFHGHRLD